MVSSRPRGTGTAKFISSQAPWSPTGTCSNESWGKGVVEVTRVQASEGKRRMTPVTWTLLVIVIGLAIGIIASLLPRPRTRLEPFETLTTIDIVVSALN